MGMEYEDDELKQWTWCGMIWVRMAELALTPGIVQIIRHGRHDRIRSPTHLTRDREHTDLTGCGSLEVPDWTALALIVIMSSKVRYAS